MYNSPIELLVTDIQNQIVKQQDEEIYQAVLHYVPNVDKEELLRALQYDRGQYEKGYSDGKADAMADLVRCKDCQFSKYFEESGTRKCRTQGGLYRTVQDDDFCSYGEKQEV